ncbi:hypothetical protein OKW35_003094 [Paraburkholderia sp. MM5477-R1]
MSACVALFDVATERCGTTLLDRAHDATLLPAERVDMDFPIRWPVATQNVRQLQRGAHDRAQLTDGGAEQIDVGDC